MNIALIGQGGHSKVIQEMIADQPHWRIVGCFDDKYENDFYEKGRYYGPVESVLKLNELLGDVQYIIAIGNNKVRKAIYEKLSLSFEHYATLIHKTATVSMNAEIGPGTVIMPGAVVNVDSRIGEHCIINTNAVVEHDNLLDNFVHISPNATLAGSVKIGEGVHVGAGATIIPNIKIDKWAIIGAGGVVIDDVTAFNTVVGVPARTVKNSITGGV